MKTVRFDINEGVDQVYTLDEVNAFYLKYYELDMIIAVEWYMGEKKIKESFYSTLRDGLSELSEEDVAKFVVKIGDGIANGMIDMSSLKRD